MTFEISIVLFIVMFKFHRNYFLFQEDQDWGIVAMVLDRLFLWTFAITAISGSLIILSESPYIYDITDPIDIKFSKIAQQESRIFDEKLLA